MMKICWLGTYNPEYPRNDILLRGFQKISADVEIIECRVDRDVSDRRKQLTQKLKNLNNNFDIVYAAFPVNFSVIIAKIYTRKPVVMDALCSMYDSAVSDRKEFAWYHPRAIKLWLSDWISALVADYMVVDTEADADYWAQTFPGVRRKKIKVLYTGIQDHIFYPVENHPKNDEKFLVSFHGTFIPLQGIEKIVETAKILSDRSDIHFQLIGNGQTFDDIDRMVKKYELSNITFIERCPAVEVVKHSRPADVILGIFGETDKAFRVIPNKVYEGLGLKKPVITMDTPAVREIFDDRHMVLVPGTPESIAEAILLVKDNPELAEQVVNTAYDELMKKYSPEPLANELYAFLKEHVI